MANRQGGVNRRALFSTMLLGGLIAWLFLERPYEFNYNMDEEAGIKNITAKAKKLAGDASIYEMRISSQPEEPDMDFMTLLTEDTINEKNTQIRFNRSGAFSNSVDREEKRYARNNSIYYDISNLQESLLLIEECKKFIPDGYQYKNIENLSIGYGRINNITICVDPNDYNNIEKKKYVYHETYRKAAGRGRRGKTYTADKVYYIMTFEIDKEGKVQQR